MKGQISIVEAIIAAVVLLVAFSFIIRTEIYENKWKDAIESVKGRDILLSADRMGLLYGHSFSSQDFGDYVKGFVSTGDSIINIDLQGTPEDRIYVACDCTSEQIDFLESSLSDVQFNGRTVASIVCSTTLPTINSCGSGSKYPDVLVIWGYRNLDNSINALSDFSNAHGGIIEIADMQEAHVDAAQRRIFGLKWLAEGPFPSGSDEFSIPHNASQQLTYQPYKWFHHMPNKLSAVPIGSIPTENGIQNCASSATEGNFKFRGTARKFWICGGASVYLDTDDIPNDVADTIKLEREKFSIGGANFMVNYIDAGLTRISFKPNYAFDDFLVIDETYNKLYPIDNDADKILLHMNYWDEDQQRPVAVSVLNRTNGRTVWLADFGRGGLVDLGDDHKQLAASIIFSLLGRETMQPFSTVGSITSYINANNTDILDLYRIDLEVGSPF